MRLKIPDSASGGIRISIISILQAQGLSLADLALKGGLERVLVIMRSQWQSVHEIVLREISCGEGIPGHDICSIIQSDGAVQHRAVDITRIRHNGAKAA